MPPRLTDEIIEAAIEGYRRQRERIDEKIRELQAIRSGQPTATTETTAPAPRRGRGRRRLSAEARARISAAQKARWAKSKGDSEPSHPAAAPKKKRRMSKEGRARIIAATKARWARVRAEKEAAARKSGRKAAA